MTNSQRDDNSGCAGWLLATLILAAFGVYGICTTIWPGEREGSIKTEDCRAKIPIKEGSTATWFKTFTCSYRKTVKGMLMGGSCESVATTTDGRCETAYFYDKEAAKVCTDPQHPYLGFDDMCHTEPQ